MRRKITNELFVKEGNKIHNGKYDYSKVDLQNRDDKGRVCIICPIHGEFWQVPFDHLNGHGCSLCSRIIYDTESFIKKAKEVHGDKYDYSKVEYKGSKKRVCIICPTHGAFMQLPNCHINGEGCRLCSYEERSKSKLETVEKFIKKAKEVHGDKYDYSKVEYKGSEQNVTIICPIHGEFQQLPSNHLSGHGCKECGKIIRANKKRKTLAQFIEEAQHIHGDRYDYGKVEYTGIFDPITIICKKHGEFPQRPNDHLQGHGCPKCANSILENNVRLELENNFITYEGYKTFPWLKNSNTNYPYKLDFYLPKYNLAIECQGEQHFKPISFFGGLKRLHYYIKNDLDKKNICEKNNIKIIYFLDEKYNDFLEKEDIKFNKTKDLVKYILDYGKDNT